MIARQPNGLLDRESLKALVALYQSPIKEVAYGDASLGGSPERSQAVPFVAEEICQGRQ